MSDEENVLVTGGAGYIGSHIVRDLGEKGYYPLVYDNLSTGNPQAVLAGELIEGEMDDTVQLTRLINQYEIKSVIHFAAYIQVEESVENPLKYYQNNSVNTLNLIKVCIENGVENFVFSSTAAVYGIPEKMPVNESFPLLPINPYGSSKVVSEMVLKDAAAVNPDFNYVALRYFNVAGADMSGRIGQKYPMATHLLTLTLHAALGLREELQVFGTDYDTRDGTAIRDYIHVDDLASAHLLALDYLKVEKESRILNCGYGTGSTVLEVLKTAKEVTGVDFAVSHSGRRAGDPPELVADSSLIQRDLGWKPRHNNLKTIVQSAWGWELKLRDCIWD